MSARTAWSVLGAFVLVSCFIGCQGTGPGVERGCPVALADVARLPSGLRASGTLRVDSTTIGFALERNDETLTLVGFTPFGTRAFSVQQNGTAMQIDDFVGQRMGIDPVWLVDALHRAVLIEAPTDIENPDAEWRWHDERVTERFDAAGKRTTRHFAREGVGAHALTLVHYLQWEGVGEERIGARSPSDMKSAGTIATVDNPWCGYHGSLVLHTRERGRSTAEDEVRSEK